jgi:hypothetical protein
MSAQLFDDPPMVVAGETASGSKYAQFWMSLKWAGTVRNVSAASMTRSKDGRTALNVDGDCPDAWLPDVWLAYTGLRLGVLPEATHTITHNHGTSTLTAIEVVS